MYFSVIAVITVGITAMNAIPVVPRVALMALHLAILAMVEAILVEEDATVEEAMGAEEIVAEAVIN